LIALSLVLTAQSSVPQEQGGPQNFVLLFDILNFAKEMGDAVTFFYAPLFSFTLRSQPPTIN